MSKTSNLTNQIADGAPGARCGDGKPHGVGENRILCTALRTDVNQMCLSALGREQTRIVYSFIKSLTEFKGIAIRSISTSRSQGAAGSFMVLSDLHGDAERLEALGRKIQHDPWLVPGGKQVEPEAVVDLQILAPPNQPTLHDALSLISGDYGINIESMMHRTRYDDGSDRGHWSSRGAGAGLAGGSSMGTGSAGGRTELGTAGRSEKSGRISTGLDFGPGTDRAGGGTGGAETGEPGGGGTEGVGADFEPVYTATHMRLELPAGTDFEKVLRGLERVGPDWELRWEHRRAGGGLDPATRRLFYRN